jgi:hypothetical protein
MRLAAGHARGGGCGKGGHTDQVAGDRARVRASRRQAAHDRLLTGLPTSFIFHNVYDAEHLPPRGRPALHRGLHLPVLSQGAGRGRHVRDQVPPAHRRRHCARPGPDHSVQALQLGCPPAIVLVRRGVLRRLQPRRHLGRFHPYPRTRRLPPLRPPSPAPARCRAGGGRLSLLPTPPYGPRAGAWAAACGPQGARIRHRRRSGDGPCCTGGPDPIPAHRAHVRTAGRASACGGHTHRRVSVVRQEGIVAPSRGANARRTSGQSDPLGCRGQDGPARAVLAGREPPIPVCLPPTSNPRTRCGPHSSTSPPCCRRWSRCPSTAASRSSRCSMPAGALPNPRSTCCHAPSAAPVFSLVAGQGAAPLPVLCVATHAGEVSLEVARPLGLPSFQPVCFNSTQV